MRKFFIVTIVALALLPLSALAQLTPSSSVVTVRAVTDHDTFREGASYRLLVEMRFDEGWHSQSHTPSGPGLIATHLEISAPAGIAIGRIRYPVGEMREFSFSEEPLSTYAGTAYLGVTFAIDEGMAPGEYALVGALTIQNCNEHSCLSPSTIPLSIPVIVTENEGSRANKEIFAKQSVLFSDAAETVGDISVGDYLAENGLLLTFIFVFLGGLALNLTPCVYPLIPITISYFGGQSEEKKQGLVIHALFYLFGMTVMYSLLGLFAALTGSLFGALLQHWAVIGLIVVILVGLALSMFGLYDIRVPAALADLGGKNRRGYVGTFLMGLTVGIIAAPCIGPFVLGLLTFVGERQDPVLGFTLFFTLGLGLGTPFVGLALFSGSVSLLPRSGGWMLWIRSLFGVILLGMALYFAAPLIADGLFLWLAPLALAGAGIYLAFLTGVKTKGGAWGAVKGAALLVGLAGALFLHQQLKPVDGLVWQEGSEAALEAALQSGRPVIVDFSADWCIPCKELVRFTFTNEAVMKEGERFALITIDLTHEGEHTAIKKRFGVVGVPTLLFFDSEGSEISSLRLVGFEEPEKFVERMKKAGPTHP